MTQYKGVHIPLELYEQAQPLMEPNGYRSFAELVCAALREKLAELIAIERQIKEVNEDGAKAV